MDNLAKLETTIARSRESLSRRLGGERLEQKVDVEILAFYAGAIYALQRACELGYSDEVGLRTNSLGGVWDELRVTTRALGDSEETIPREFLAGFYFNTAVSRLGWSIDRALSTPKRFRSKPGRRARIRQTDEVVAAIRRHEDLKHWEKRAERPLTITEMAEAMQAVGAFVEQID